MIKALGREDAEKLLCFNNSAADITVQTNTLKASVSEVSRLLDSENVSYTESTAVPGSFDIKKSGGVFKLKTFSDGKIYVQDRSAYCAVLAADPQPGMRVLDVCAAPGGKSITSAVLMKNEGQIISCDIHKNKLGLISSNAERLGIGIIDTAAADAREYDPTFESKFDVVIADVPCSGFGVIRKKPEIRYKSDEETARLCKIQSAIIKNVCRYVKPGGVLLYSTCTLLKREDEDIVNDFLSDVSGYQLEPFNIDGIVSSDTGMATIWPHHALSDGFFIAKLRRNL